MQKSALVNASLSPIAKIKSTTTTNTNNINSHGELPSLASLFIASAVESFYRSAMNYLINEKVRSLASRALVSNANKSINNALSLDAVTRKFTAPTQAYGTLAAKLSAAKPQLSNTPLNPSITTKFNRVQVRIPSLAGARGMASTSMRPSYLSKQLLYALFPQMHVQILVRCLYISGLKNLRASFDNIDVDQWFGLRAAMYRANGSVGGGTASISSADTAVTASNTTVGDSPLSIIVARSNIKTNNNNNNNIKSNSNICPKICAIGANTLLAVAPGVILCPLASILEAVNAGKANPERLSLRWTRGFTPRVTREIIFAIGINQMADYCTRFVASIDGNSTSSSNAGRQYMNFFLGSITAGVLAGYLSHVPHVLSTLKLMNPRTPYLELWQSMYIVPTSSTLGGTKGITPLTKTTTTTNTTTATTSFNYVLRRPPPSFIKGHAARDAAAKAAAILFPVGVVRRSIQIAGTFAIINVITFALRGL